MKWYCFCSMCNIMNRVGLYTMILHSSLILEGVDHLRVALFSTSLLNSSHILSKSLNNTSSCASLGSARYLALTSSRLASTSATLHWEWVHQSYCITPPANALQVHMCGGYTGIDMGEFAIDTYWQIVAWKFVKWNTNGSFTNKRQLKIYIWRMYTLRKENTQHQSYQHIK